MPWVKLHWRVEPALAYFKLKRIYFLGLIDLIGRKSLGVAFLASLILLREIKIAADVLNTFEFLQKFPNEELARNCFEMRRRVRQAVCSHGGSKSHSAPIQPMISAPNITYFSEADRRKAT
jgi:hypothetical protein